MTACHIPTKGLPIFAIGLNLTILIKIMVTLSFFLTSNKPNFQVQTLSQSSVTSDWSEFDLEPFLV